LFEWTVVVNGSTGVSHILFLLYRAARSSSIESTNALKSYCLDPETCRRKALLVFFHEKPPFGDRCGTCDTCLSKEKYGKDATRDFGPIVRFILQGIQFLKEQGLTALLRVLNGNMVESFRYHANLNPKEKSEQLLAMRKALPHKKVTNDLLKEILVSLVSSKYILQATKQFTIQGFQKSTTVFSLGHKACMALSSPENPITLPVPESVRQWEHRQDLKRQKLQDQLAKKGMLESVPQDELQDVDGPTVRAYTTWFNYMDRKAAQERDLAVYEELLELVETWRSQTAVAQHMAPAAVMAEHLMYTVAYVTASLLPGCHVEEAALVAVGVRSRNLNDLVYLLNAWAERCHQTKASRDEVTEDLPMAFPRGLIKPPKWQFATMKVAKKTGEPSWMSTYLHFVKDKDTLQEIAMSKLKTSPVQVSTVVGHMQQALVLGFPIDLSRLLHNSNAPTKQEWEQLAQATADMGIDVTGNPETSGVDGDKFIMTDALRPIMGEQVCGKHYKERSPEEQDKFSFWFNRLKWFYSIKRVGLVPSFGTLPAVVELAPDASKYTCPSTLDDENAMALKLLNRDWIVPKKAPINTTNTSTTDATPKGATEAKGKVGTS
jgi:hypothetical protein